jgi:hypothetical protein
MPEVVATGLTSVSATYFVPQNYTNQDFWLAPYLGTSKLGWQGQGRRRDNDSGPERTTENY